MKTAKSVVYSFNETIDTESGNLIITGITSSLGIEYIEIEKCKSLMGKSTKTARREVDKIKVNNTIPKKYRNRAIMIQGKYFVSRYLIENRPKKKEVVKKGQTLFEGYVKLLSKYDWKIAGALRFKHDKSIDTNTKYMNGLNEFLVNNLGNDYALFYVIEPNDKLFQRASDAHHIHYMISLNKNQDVNSWIKKVELYFALYDVMYNNTSWCKIYNPDLGYDKYCAAKIKSKKDNYSLFTGFI